MIVRELPNGQLLCIHQTTHALMAQEFCRYWGNDEFAAPEPYTEVMLGIAQHDNGWYEWESAPKLRADGYPEDFMHESEPMAKLQLWQRGIDRLYAQHPYAAVLMARHAAILYAGDLKQELAPPLRQGILNFIAAQEKLLEQVRTLLGADALWASALAEDSVEANTRLLQIGDNASLYVTIPWGNPANLTNCPVDGRGVYTTLHMSFDDQVIHFEPWPFQVEQFAVSIYGHLLNQRAFPTTAAYHTALAEAPLICKTWQVVRV
jgi:hypothetical protein